MDWFALPSGAIGWVQLYHRPRHWVRGLDAPCGAQSGYAKVPELLARSLTENEKARPSSTALAIALAAL